MATMPQFVPSEVVHDLDFPQREAAFFYGLFLRGHSADKLRRDIEVPAVVLAKCTARQNATRSFVTFLRAWWITAVTSWPSSISWWVRTATPSAFNSLPIFSAAVLPCTFVQVKKCQAT